MKQPILFRSSVHKGFFRLLVAICVISMAIDPIMHRHSHFSDTGLKSMDATFGFYGLVRFIGCILIIIITVIASTVLKVREGYYQNDF